MRTTLTLDPDVAAAIDREVRQHPRKSQKEVVNDLIRSGLKARKQSNPPKDFQLKTFDMGVVPGLNYDDVWGLLEYAESLERK